MIPAVGTAIRWGPKKTPGTVVEHGESGLESVRIEWEDHSSQWVLASAIEWDGQSLEDTELIATDGFRLTDTGNSSRLIRLCGNDLRYVRAWGKWIAYRSGRYIVDEKDAIVTEFAKGVPRELMLDLHKASDAPLYFVGGEPVSQRDLERAWAKKSESGGAIREMVRLARGDSEMMVEHEMLDADTELLNLQNVTIELGATEARRHDPNDLMTMQAPTKYDPDATCSLWEECLETWQPDPEVRRYLQIRAGACATGIRTETFDVDYGTGANGKSQFWGAIMSVLGPYARVPDKSLLVATKHDTAHPTNVADLFRRRCVVAAETKKQSTLNEDQIKNLTGEKFLTARRMREDFWQFEPSYTIVMTSNYKPIIQGTDDGIWRRVRLVPWEVTIPENERDEFLGVKLELEAPGILNWILEGARMFLADGWGELPASVRVATAEYRTGQDVVGRFVSEMLVFTPESETFSSDINKALEAWGAEQGHRWLSMKAITLALMKAGAVSSGNQVRREGQRGVLWTGVALVDPPSRSTNYGEIARQGAEQG